jgi:hypothetical protein
VLIPEDLNFCGDEVESNFPCIRIERNWNGGGWRGEKFFKRDPSLTLFARDNDKMPVLQNRIRPEHALYLFYREGQGARARQIFSRLGTKVETR